MNDKDINLDALENADEDTIKKIAADCPASDEEKERMFAMSRKIYKERTMESNNINDMEVSGVDVYKRPAWLKFAAAACHCHRSRCCDRRRYTPEKAPHSA